MENAFTSALKEIDKITSEGNKSNPETINTETLKLIIGCIGLLLGLLLFLK